MCAYTRTELSKHTGLLTYSTLRENACIKSPHHYCWFCLLFCFSPNRLRIFRRWHYTTAQRYREERYTSMDYVICACGSPFWEGGGTHVYTISIVRVIRHCRKKTGHTCGWTDFCTGRYRLWANTCIGYIICACSLPFWEGGATHVHTVSIMRVIHRRGKK